MRSNSHQDKKIEPKREEEETKGPQKSIWDFSSI